MSQAGDGDRSLRVLKGCSLSQQFYPSAAKVVHAPRTLFITQDYPPDRGGIARLYGELCERMPNVDVSTVAAADGSVVPEANVHRMPFSMRRAHRPINIFRWTRWATAFARDQGVALVHAGNIRPSGYVAAILRRKLGIPYIVYVHGKDLLKERRKGQNRWLVRAGTREILGNAAGIIANSSATANLAKQLLRHVGRRDAAARVHVVHPGANPARFANTQSPPGVSPAVGRLPVLLSVARLVPRKGIDTVIESLRAVLTVHPGTTYVVVGSGPDRGRLEQLAKELGVIDHIRFVGDVDDAALPACYASADVFVLPTRQILSDDEIEGFGIAYVEAAAAGVPSIAAGVGGVADAVIDDVTGFLVPPSSPSAVARATLQVLGDPDLRQRLGQNARANVERHLNWDRAAREVLRLVEDVIRSRARRVGLGAPEPLVRPGLERESGRA